MIKHEQAITTKLQKYFKARMQPSFFWEIKHIRSTNYAFRSDRSFSNELRNLLIGERSGICYKLSDAAAQGGPFDGFYIKAPGYFFIHYEKSRLTYQISCTKMQEIVDSDAKSLSEEVAESISINVILIKPQ
jgi:hypothetical protein